MTPTERHLIEIAALVGGGVAAWWLLKQQTTTPASYTPQYNPNVPGYSSGSTPSVLSGNYPGGGANGVMLPPSPAMFNFNIPGVGGPSPPSPFSMVTGGTTIGGTTVAGNYAGPTSVGGPGAVTTGGYTAGNTTSNINSPVYTNTTIGGNVIGGNTIGGVNQPYSNVSNYGGGGGGCCTAPSPAGNAVATYTGLANLIVNSIPGGFGLPGPTPGVVSIQPAGVSGGTYVQGPIGPVQYFGPGQRIPPALLGASFQVPAQYATESSFAPAGGGASGTTNTPNASVPAPMINPGNPGIISSGFAVTGWSGPILQ